MGTDYSLVDAYALSEKHALDMIVNNGGNVTENDITIKMQQPKTVPLEVSFEGHYPKEKLIPVQTKDEISFEFEGIGFALAGPANVSNPGGKNHVFQTEMYIDGELVEKVNESLVGGIILRLRDVQIDASVKNGLLKLEREFSKDMYSLKY